MSIGVQPATTLRDVSELEPQANWRIRLARSRLAAWAALCRPRTGLWLQGSSALMVLTAAGGSIDWHLPVLYSAMVAAFAYAAALINNALDSEIDAHARLMRPIAAGRLSSRAALLAAPIPAALGCAIGFATDWRVAVIGIAMLATCTLYSWGWRGSAFGVAAFALLGVLLPAGAIVLVESGFPSAHAFWVIPIGALSGAGAFMLYKLPDYEVDDVDGSRSILHWLGVDTAIAMSWAVLAAAMALAASSINVSGGNLAWLLAPLLYLILVGLFCIRMLMRRLTEIRLRLQRSLILPLLPLLPIMWLGAAASA